MDSSSNFLLAFFPLLLSILIARIYTLKYLDQPADYSNAPWWVRLMFNSGIVRLYEFKKTASIILLGAFLFSSVYIFNSSSYISLFFGPILFFGLIAHFLSIRWMDKNKAWGTEKSYEEASIIKTLDIIKKDGFVIVQMVVLLFFAVIFCFFQYDTYISDKGYQDGVKEGKEQLRQDSLRSMENK